MTQPNHLEKNSSVADCAENSYEVKNLDHLGLISAQFDALGLVELIDTMVAAG